jgi:hypothetical protein
LAESSTAAFVAIGEDDEVDSGALSTQSCLKQLKNRQQPGIKTKKNITL